MVQVVIHQVCSFFFQVIKEEKINYWHNNLLNAQIWDNHVKKEVLNSVKVKGRLNFWHLT